MIQDIEQTENKASIHEMIERFNRDGYFIFNPGIPDFSIRTSEIIKDLRPWLKELGRLQDAWQYNESVRALAINESILDTLRMLYKREPIPFQTLNFKNGTQQKAHSDTIHFQTDPAGLMCGVWIAFEETDTNNGPLFIVPGSHRLPMFTMQDFGLNHGKYDYPAYEKALEKYIEDHGLKQKQLHLKPGEAVIWHANLLHGGSPVKDFRRTRHSQVTHYFFEGASYYTPKGSDLKRDKIERRMVRDIRSRLFVKQYDNCGREISFKWHDKLLPALQRLIVGGPKRQLWRSRIEQWFRRNYSDQIANSLPPGSVK